MHQNSSSKKEESLYTINFRLVLVERSSSILLMFAFRHRCEPTQNPELSADVFKGRAGLFFFPPPRSIFLPASYCFHVFSQPSINSPDFPARSAHVSQSFKQKNEATFV